MRSKKEAEKAILAAYKEVADRKSAVEDFACVCQLAHTYLSDTEIAELIDYGYSRSRIQQLRKQQTKKEKSSA